MGPVHHQQLPLQQLQWPRLQFFHVTDMWTSQEELFSFVERHSLKCLTLRQVTLTSGSWKSFFARIRGLPSCPKIAFFGHEQQQFQGLLDLYLEHDDFPWPFEGQDRDIDVPLFRLSP